LFDIQPRAYRTIPRRANLAIYFGALYSRQDLDGHIVADPRIASATHLARVAKSQQLHDYFIRPTLLPMVSATCASDYMPNEEA